MKLPLHIDRSDLEVRNDELIIDGRALTEIVAQAGSTPLYIYSRACLKQRLTDLRAVLPRTMRLSYSVKANPHPEVLNFVAQAVDGLDVASGGELRRALATGIAGDCISFAGPGKSDEELQAAHAAGVLVCVESANELRRLAQIARATGRRATVLLRVNADFELRASGMKMSSGAKPFGIDSELLPQLLASLNQEAIDFKGFHFFAGSQCLQSAALSECLSAGCSLLADLAKGAPQTPRLFLFGGGFGVPYFPGDQALQNSDLARVLADLAQQALGELPGTQLQLELGRYIVAEAGFYVAKVIDRKHSRGRVFLVVDGGLNHNLAATGNLGQVVRRNYPVLIGNRVQGQKREKVSVVGPLCTPLDLLADQMEMTSAQVGDLVVVFQSGAYGLSASPTGFLGHPPPREVFL